MSTIMSYRKQIPNYQRSNQMSGPKDCEIHWYLSACDNAERMLPDFEAAHPLDKLQRAAIETTRKWIVGKATDEEREAAMAAADDDAWFAALSAACEIV